MTNPGNVSDTSTSSSLWFRCLLFLVFLISVNVLAGYIALTLNYPSLWNVTASFWEYAVPLPFGWGLAHIPSMLLCGIPLLLLSNWQERYIRYFRVTCMGGFLMLLVVLGKKVPFILFPCVDALVALILSFVIVPPARRYTPILASVFALLILVLGSFTYSAWRHQTPEITRVVYVDGAFTLKSITVNSDFRKEMIFDVDLNTRLLEDQLCAFAQVLADSLLQDYPFDNSYSKKITVNFNPLSESVGFGVYGLGELSLDDAHKEQDGQFACYMKYKKMKSSE